MLKKLMTSAALGALALGTAWAGATEESSSAGAAAGADAMMSGAYREAPMLAAMVAAGELPPVEERLPAEPVVITPLDEVGRYGGNLSVGIPSAWAWFGDPQSAVGPETLMRIKTDYSGVVPNIVRSWEWEPDGKTVVMRFVEDAKWSDGAPFSADAVMFWYDHIVGNETLTPQPHSRWTPGGELMKLTQVDEYTIRYEFAAPYPLIEMQYAHYAGGPNSYSPGHYLQQFHPEFQDAAKLADMTKEAGFDEWHQLFNNKNRVCSVIACGEQPTMQPYRRIASNPQSHTLERNPYYWKVDPAGNQLPYVDGVTIHVVQDREVLVLKAIQGEFDLFGQNSALADFPVYQENKEKGGYEVYNWIVTDANQMGIQFNLTIEDPVKREVFRDKRFRIAFSHAIDREEVNETTQFGLATPMQATVHRMTPWFKEEYANAHVEYDPEMANRMLDEMGLNQRDAQGYRLMKDGRRLSVTWEYPPDTHTWAPPVVELVVDYAKDIGLEVLVKADDRALYGQRVRQNLVEMNEWNVVGFTTTMLIDPRVWVPWRDMDEAVWYTQWLYWYLSGGERGEEPIAEVKQIREWWEQYTTTVDLAERDRLIDNVLRTHAENAFVIGLIGDVMKPVLVNTELVNVPTEGAHGYDAIRFQPNHPEQFFFRG